MTKYVRNQRGFADIIIMGAVLAVFYVSAILVVPHKAEEPKVVNQGVESAPSEVTETK